MHLPQNKKEMKRIKCCSYFGAISLPCCMRLPQLCQKQLCRVNLFFFNNRIFINKYLKKYDWNTIFKTIINTRSPAPQAPPRMGAGSPTQRGSTWKQYIRCCCGSLAVPIVQFLSPSGDLGIGLVWHNLSNPHRTAFWSDWWNPPQTELNHLWWVLSCS